MVKTSIQEAARALQDAFNREGASADERADAVDMAVHMADIMPYSAGASELVRDLAGIFEKEVRAAFLDRLDLILNKPENSESMIAERMAPVISELRRAPG